MSKELIKGYIEDLVADLLYYDRKEDEELKVGDIDKMIKNCEISIDEMVTYFKEFLKAGIYCE